MCVRVFVCVRIRMCHDTQQDWVCVECDFNKQHSAQLRPHHGPAELASRVPSPHAPLPPGRNGGATSLSSATVWLGGPKCSRDTPRRCAPMGPIGHNPTRSATGCHDGYSNNKSTNTPMDTFIDAKLNVLWMSIDVLWVLGYHSSGCTTVWVTTVVGALLYGRTIKYTIGFSL